MAACRDRAGYRHLRARPSRRWRQLARGRWPCLPPLTDAACGAVQRRRLSATTVSPAGRAPAASKELQAASGGRKYLARIAQPTWVERVLDALHLRDVVLGEDQRHEVFLLHADAVFA